MNDMSLLMDFDENILQVKKEKMEASMPKDHVWKEKEPKKQRLLLWKIVKIDYNKLKNELPIEVLL